ncbi:MAG: HAMP domain-containing histidine kinase [Oscillospiraceae bacterium]|nr:HAMP domain-containing histidine kinase [Oscillospiraceae bacterium]
MRIKTFIATYLLFLFILFLSVGIVSVYLNNSQINMLKEKSASQYQTITASLARDITILQNRYQHNMRQDIFYDAVDTLIIGYARYYRRHNVYINITDLTLSERDRSSPGSEVSFINIDDRRFIYISGALPYPFEHILLEYRLDITENIADMRNIQNILLLSAIIFSIIAAFALYFILSSIFKPLSVVAKASGNIADGQFCERIHVKGKNELAQVAYDFNRMAEKIENQISFLEEEAVNKQQFVDNFAHEIRTPLTSIYGYAEYLQKATLDEREIIESAEYIMNEANHMKNIANSLLELATLRQYEPVKNEISISKLFDDISQTMEKSLRDKGARLICRNDADTIYGQEDLIRSLLLNLCANALNACEPDAGIIQLEAKELPTGKVAISVTDNGCGIPADSLSKITEPFYRVDKSRSREFGGTGLGLALCKQIAEAHGAEMNVNSNADAGTTVTISFATFTTS